MTQFRLRAAGGLGIEPRPAPGDDGLEVMLKLVGNNGGGLKPDDLDPKFAYRLAVIAEATRSLVPPASRAGKDPAKWLQWATEMRTASLALAGAAAKDRPAIRQAALKVARSCNDCHKVFRDN